MQWWLVHSQLQLWFSLLTLWPTVDNPEWWMTVKHFLSSFVRQFAGVKTVQTLESNQGPNSGSVTFLLDDLEWLPWWLPDSKESACNVGDPGSIPGSGRSPGGGYVYLIQYSCLGNPMDRGAWTMDMVPRQPRQLVSTGPS